MLVVSHRNKGGLWVKHAVRRDADALLEADEGRVGLPQSGRVAAVLLHLIPVVEEQRAPYQLVQQSVPQPLVGVLSEGGGSR